MPIEPSPKRADYKTRKEYRFAHKNVKRNNMRQPIVIATAVVTVVAFAITKSGAVGAIALIGTPIAWLVWVRPWWKRQEGRDAIKAAEKAGTRFKVTCPKCSAAVTMPAGNGIKCPECGFAMKVTPNAKPTPPIASAPQTPTLTPTAAVGSTASEIERLAGLHAQGALTDAEFAAAKSKVLG
jgi:uncharacterized membrane protein